MLVVNSNFWKNYKFLDNKVFFFLYNIYNLFSPDLYKERFINMKIIKKFSFITLLIIAILSMNLSIVNATTDCSAQFKLTLNSSNTNVGDEISITLNISTINGFDGIHLIVAKKVYNSNIFEYIGCYPQNGWDIKGDATNILLQRDAGDVKTGAICTLKFKILKLSDTSTITLSNLDATGTNGDVYFEDNNVNSPSVNIKITEKIEKPIISEEIVTTTRSSMDSSERTEVVDTKKNETQVSTATNNKTNNTIVTNPSEPVPNTNIVSKSSEPLANTNIVSNSSKPTTNTNNSNGSDVKEITKTIPDISNNIAQDDSSDLVVASIDNTNTNSNNDNSKTNSISDDSYSNIEVQTNNNNTVTTIITTILSSSIISAIAYCFIIKK